MTSGVVYGFSYTGDEQVTDVLSQVSTRFNQEWDVQEAVLNGLTLTLTVDTAEYSDVLGLDSLRFEVVHLEGGTAAVLIYPAPLKIESTGSRHLKYLPIRGSARDGWGSAEIFGALMGWDELPTWVFFEEGIGERHSNF